MARGHVRIHLAPSGSDSFVEVDGQRLHNACAVTVEGGVARPTAVRVDLINVEVDIEVYGEHKTVVEEVVRRYELGQDRD